MHRALLLTVQAEFLIILVVLTNYCSAHDSIYLLLKWFCLRCKLWMNP